MANTPESKVKRKVTDILKQAGAYYFYPVTGGYGKSGVPDIIVCYKSVFIGIECKAGRGKTTALQEQQLAAIDRAGGIAMVVNENNIDMVSEVLETIDAE